MSFPRYPEYKDSGVEWLGEVPRHWEINQLKHAYSVVGGSTPSSGVPEFWDGDIVWVTPADLSRLKSFEIVSSLRTITDAGLASCGTNLLPAGSIVLSTRAPIGSLGIAGVELCTNQGCKGLVPTSEQCSLFGAYLLAVMGGELNIRGRGTTFLELSGEALGAIKIPLPPELEQARIAAFLDRETAKINDLVAEQQNLIALLKEKRQALISHAVTKGLDPDVPMKDSGVAWLGEVPAHWRVLKLKHVSPEITVGIVVEPSKYYCETGVPALRSLNVQPGSILLENMVFISEEANQTLAKSRLCAGDIVAVRSGQPGTSAVVPKELDDCNCIDLLIIRRPEQGSEHYLCWYLSSDPARRQFDEGSGGAIQQHFNVGTATSLLVATPPPAEQLAIDQFLSSEVSRIDALVFDAEATISLLQERRTALISAAVTGKIDVRHLPAEPIPEPA